MDDEGSGHVVQLGIRPKTTDPDRTVESVGHSMCRHGRFLVDERLAEVECAECHENLNPMWVLRQLANRESQQAQKRDHLRKLVKQLGDRVRYKCRACGEMNDMARIVNVKRW